MSQYDFYHTRGSSSFYGIPIFNKYHHSLRSRLTLVPWLPPPLTIPDSLQLKCWKEISSRDVAYLLDNVRLMQSFLTQMSSDKSIYNHLLQKKKSSSFDPSLRQLSDFTACCESKGGYLRDLWLAGRRGCIEMHAWVSADKIRANQCALIHYCDAIGKWGQQRDYALEGQ